MAPNPRQEPRSHLSIQCLLHLSLSSISEAITLLILALFLAMTSGFAHDPSLIDPNLVAAIHLRENFPVERAHSATSVFAPTFRLGRGTGRPFLSVVSSIEPDAQDANSRAPTSCPLWGRLKGRTQGPISHHPHRHHPEPTKYEGPSCDDAQQWSSGPY
jgi:hypothetical protein